MSSRLDVWAQLTETVHRLRAPGGCPWDRAQTHQSLRQYLIEEAYEVLEVLDQIHAPADLKREEVHAPFQEELGDLLMQVMLHSEMAREEGAFSVSDVAQGLNDKLIRRHPHVFGDAQAQNADEALLNWEKKKAEEKKAKKAGASVLDGLPKGLPSLQRAGRMLEKVSKVGFQWKDMHGPLDKVDEELEELKVEIRALELAPGSAEVRARVQAELGDLLLTICNLAFLTQVHPEDALRGTLSRFELRFRHVETRLQEQGKKPEDVSLEEMDRYWNEAKKLGK